MRLFQRFQFRLRSLLLLVALAGILLGWIRYRINAVSRQREIVAKLEDVGCMVTYWVPTEEPDVFMNDYEASGPAWLRGIFGDHFFTAGLTVEILQPLGKTIRTGNGCFTNILSYGKYDDIRDISELRGLKFVYVGPEVTQEVIAKLRHVLPEVTIQVDQSRMEGATAKPTGTRTVAGRNLSESQWSRETDPYSE